MFVSKDEFLKGISDKERERYEEAIEYHTAKSKREGRIIATAADNLYHVIQANGDHTPKLIIETYKMLTEHFEVELSILKQRYEKIAAKSDS